MAAASRLKIVDALRGFAVAQMVVYHFIYDLNYFGWVRVRMLVDAQWIAWRTAIVSQFLLLVGISLMLGAVSCTVWALFGTALRPVLTSPRAIRAFNIVMALLLLASLYPVFMDA